MVKWENEYSLKLETPRADATNSTLLNMLGDVRSYADLRGELRQAVYQQGYAIIQNGYQEYRIEPTGAIQEHRDKTNLGGSYRTDNSALFRGTFGQCVVWALQQPPIDDGREAFEIEDTDDTQRETE